MGELTAWAPLLRDIMPMYDREAFKSPTSWEET
jgi:hypothetical protein